MTLFCPRTNGNGPRPSCLEVSNTDPESSVPCNHTCYLMNDDQQLQSKQAQSC